MNIKNVNGELYIKGLEAIIEKDKEIIDSLRISDDRNFNIWTDIVKWYALNNGSTAVKNLIESAIKCEKERSDIMEYIGVIVGDETLNNAQKDNKRINPRQI